MAKYPIILILKKKKCKVRFLPFFSPRKKQSNFFPATSKIYLLNCISWGEGPSKKKLNLSLNLQVKFREFSEKEIRKNRESAGNLENGNS